MKKLGDFLFMGLLAVGYAAVVVFVLLILISYGCVSLEAATGNITVHFINGATTAAEMQYQTGYATGLQASVALQPGQNVTMVLPRGEDHGMYEYYGWNDAGWVAGSNVVRLHRDNYGNIGQQSWEISEDGGGGIGDADTEKFLFNLQKAEVEAKKAADAGFTEITIPYSDKKVRVRVEVADGFFDAAKQAATTGNEQILIRFMAQNGMITPTSKKNDQGQVEFQRPKTELESAQEKARLEQTEKTRAESSEKSAEQLKNRQSVSFDNQQTASDMISYVKSNPEVFRLLNTGKTRDVVMKALGAGIQTPSGSINLPVNILKQQGLSDEQIDTLQLFAQSAAQLNIQFRKTMQGQGQITEKESQLAAELGAMATDSDVVIRLKSELLIERSKFDQKEYSLWLKNRKSMSYDEFLDSADYKALKSEYSDTLKNIRESNADLLRKKPKPTAAPATPSNPNARPPATSLPSNDPSVPPGYIRDPQTKVIRKKREGE